MAIAVYTKTASKNVAGNYQKVFFTEVANITSVTGTTELTGVTMVGATLFQMFTAEIDTVQFKEEAEGGPNYFTKQSLIMKFAKRTRELLAAIETITDSIACGIVAIRVDGNGTAWMSGWDAAAIDKASRPYNQVKVTYGSGLKPSDADGNVITVELIRESEHSEIPFDDTESRAIVGVTATYCAYT